MNQIAEILIQRLENKGLAPIAIPGFIRDVAYTMSNDPHPNLTEMNRRLHLLGWDRVELDYHTLQLIIANSEVERP